MGVRGRSRRACTRSSTTNSSPASGRASRSTTARPRRTARSMAILGREAAYTGQRITWKQFKASKENLAPEGVQPGGRTRSRACRCPGRTSSCDPTGSRPDAGAHVSRIEDAGRWIARTRRSWSIAMTRPIGRRDFLRATAAVRTCAMTGVVPAFGQEKRRSSRRPSSTAWSSEGRHAPREVRTGEEVRLPGVEIDSPGTPNLDELVKAQQGRPASSIHGVIDSVHWRDTLSHPDETVRAKGLARPQGGPRRRQDRRGRHRPARPRRREQGRDLRAVLRAVAGRGEEGAAARREARREDRHRGRLEQLHHQAGAAHRVRRRLQERVGRGVLRLLEHDQVRRPVGGVDSQARQADAEVRLQGLQQGEAVGRRSARATRTGRRC